MLCAASGGRKPLKWRRAVRRGRRAPLAALSRALLLAAEILAENESGALPALLDLAGWSSPIAHRKVA